MTQPEKKLAKLQATEKRIREKTKNGPKKEKALARNRKRQEALKAEIERRKHKRKKIRLAAIAFLILLGVVFAPVALLIGLIYLLLEFMTGGYPTAEEVLDNIIIGRHK
jgi:ABC-type siderophore export system fused ATPase/permease subunit